MLIYVDLLPRMHLDAIFLYFSQLSNDRYLGQFLLWEITNTTALHILIMSPYKCVRVFLKKVNSGKIVGSQCITICHRLYL